MRSTLILLVFLAGAMAMQTNFPQQFLASREGRKFKFMLKKIEGTPLGKSVATLLKIKMAAGAGGKYDNLYKAFDALTTFLENKLAALE